MRCVVYKRLGAFLPINRKFYDIKDDKERRVDDLT